MYHSRWRAATGGCGGAEVVSTEWVGRIGNGESKPGPGEDAYDGLFEVCRQFLDEGVPDDGVDGYGKEQAEGEGKETICSERCAGSAVMWVGSGGWRDDFAHALDEGRGIELGAEDFVRAVGHDGDAPVADEGDKLPGLRGLDLGA